MNFPSLVKQDRFSQSFICWAIFGLSWLLFSSVNAQELQCKLVRTIAAPEAVQAAVADEQVVYAINNTSVASYDRTTGQRLRVSTGDAQHLNSGFLWRGRIYCAHSNYPQKPERSQVKVLDPKDMQLEIEKDLGDFGGSLTWVAHHADRWYGNFAYYGDQNAKTYLVRFDASWREESRWKYPQSVVTSLGNYSVSGGLWWNDSLLVTDHDNGVLYQLRLPVAGNELELVGKHPAPFTGQGIALDLKSGGLIGIHRANRELVFASLDVLASSPRLPRDNLLVYRSQGKTPQQVTSIVDWQLRRHEIVSGMQAVMGVLPGDEKRCDLAVKIDDEADCGSYIRRLISYASEPGCRTPAYLCVPKSALLPGAKPLPAVLCLHGTDNTVGHGVVVGLGGRANRQYASELAERGYVTLAPNYPILAKYQPDVVALGWTSGTLKAVWDNMRGLDYLDTLPYIIHGRYGAIGHSLGGHNSVYTAVFDDRIRAVVSSCGLDSYLDYYDGAEKNWFPEKGWCQTRYMLRMANYRGRLQDIPFDFHEMIGALAPRHVLISAPLKDSNFRWDSVDRVAAAASEVYKLHGLPDRLIVEHPDCDHDFPVEKRNQAYELFDKVLLAK